MRKILKWGFMLGEIFLLWMFGSLIINKAYFPNPIVVLGRLKELMLGKELLLHTFISFRRIGLGILFGTVFAIPVGIALGSCKGADKYFGGLFGFLYILPKVVFLPIIIVLMGIGDLPKVFLIALVLFFQETVVIKESVSGISKDLITAVKVFGANYLQMIHYVVFPQCLPDMITSVKSVLGISVALLFITENFASITGLGYYITKSMNERNYENMYAAILVLGLLGSVLYLGLGVLEKKICKWKYLKG